MSGDSLDNTSSNHPKSRKTEISSNGSDKMQTKILELLILDKRELKKTGKYCLTKSPAEIQDCTIHHTSQLHTVSAEKPGRITR